MNKEKFEDLDDDIPSTNTESIEDWEIDSGRGFWGNQTTGYHYDDEE